MGNANNDVERSLIMNNESILSRYADEMTANQYITDPAIARDKEIKELILVL